MPSLLKNAVFSRRKQRYRPQLSGIANSLQKTPVFVDYFFDGRTTELPSLLVTLSQGPLQVDIAQDRQVSLIGSSISSQLGTLSTIQSDQAVLGSLELTTSQGSLVLVIDDQVTLNSLQLALHQGVLGLTIDCSINLSGQQSTSSLGTLYSRTEEVLSVTGLGVLCQTGSLTVIASGGDISATLTGQQLSLTQGSLERLVAESVQPTKQLIQSYLGNLVVISTSSCLVNLQGIEVLCQIEALQVVFPNRSIKNPEVIRSPSMISPGFVRLQNRFLGGD